MSLITVAMVEDDARMRERFANVIGAAPSLRFAFAALTGAELLAWFAENVVDVLLVDLGLPDQSGFEVIRRCCRWQPACAVMVITMFGDEANMLKAFEAGARGYLLKDGTQRPRARPWPAQHARPRPRQRDRRVIADRHLVRRRHRAGSRMADPRLNPLPTQETTP